VVRPTLEAVQPRVIVEIGVGGGEQSRLVLERTRDWDSTIHLIDPSPEVDPEEWAADFGPRLRVHRRRSLDVLPEIQSIDAALIDGDHNWYTVINELRLIEQGALEQERPPPVVLLHDVGWPYGRRDLYYDPDSIPAEYRHPYARLGLDPGSETLLEGAGMNAYLCNAEDEGTPRNGVLTAVEDFVEESSIAYRLLLLPGIHGIAVLAAESLIATNPSLQRALDDRGQADLLRRQSDLIERDRTRLQAALARSKSRLDEHDRNLERLRSELEPDDQALVTPSAQLGAVEERLEAVSEDRARLAAAIDERDAELEEMSRRIGALRDEHRSGEKGQASAHHGASIEDSGSRAPAGSLRSIDERETQFVRTFTERYEGLTSRQRAIAAAGGQDPLLAVDGIGLLVPADTDGPSGVSVDVVVCVHDALPDVRRCLRSLLAAGEHTLHLILVNDGSEEETARFLRWFAAQHPSVELIEHPEPPHGYTIAANLGLAASTGDYVALLNSDTLVTAGWLDEIIELGEGDAQIGIFGPLSNAASHQSVPAVRAGGEWATNPAPAGITPDVIGLLVRRASDCLAPRVPFINGFCYVIKRAVIDSLGTFDEETFAAGFGEENDYSIRALDAGFSLSIADRAYVHHAKSRSYGSRRKEIAKDHYRRFQEKHGEDRVATLVAEIEADRTLVPLRTRLAEYLADEESLAEGFRTLVPDPLGVTFVLPGLSQGGGGGSHSVYQEAWGLRQLGVPARIALPAEHLKRARFTYPAHPEIFRDYSDDADLLDATAGSDVVVATHFRSAAQVARISTHRPDFLAAYYVQDYEPLFAMAETDPADEALLSYREVEGELLFAKTDWLCALIASLHGVPVAKVQPSLDSGLYHDIGRPGREPGDPVRIAGMVRPRTVRRQPSATLRLLERLQRELGDAVRTITFGCSPEDLERHLAPAEGERPEHGGLLSRGEVAGLLRETDIFVDASVYQAFGRTGLEAMACGCVPVLPQIGGPVEYAVDDENALLVDTLDHEATFAAVAALAQDPERIARLRAQGVQTAGRYSLIASALSEYALFDAWCRRRGITAARRSLSGLGGRAL